MTCQHHSTTTLVLATTAAAVVAFLIGYKVGVKGPCGGDKK